MGRLQEALIGECRYRLELLERDLADVREARRKVSQRHGRRWVDVNHSECIGPAGHIGALSQPIQQAERETIARI